MIPSPLPRDDSDSMGGVASAQAADPALSKWVRYGIELKSRHDCEAERSSLTHDPVVGAQMKRGECVENRSPEKP